MHRAASHNELFHPKYQYCSLSEPWAAYLHNRNDVFLPQEIEGIFCPELRCIFVKFHFDSISRRILVHSFPLVHLFFFFFLPSLNTPTVHLVLLFLDQICGSYSVMTRKEGDHIKKQLVLFLAELSTPQKRVHRVQMALNESVFMCWSRVWINVCLSRVRPIALFIITFIQLMQVNWIFITPRRYILLIESFEVLTVIHAMTKNFNMDSSLTSRQYIWWVVF